MRLSRTRTQIIPRSCKLLWKYLFITILADLPVTHQRMELVQSSHTFPNGEERPIAYASRTLTTCEKNYAQEALGLVFGVKSSTNFFMAESLLWLLTVSL